MFSSLEQTGSRDRQLPRSGVTPTWRVTAAPQSNRFSSVRGNKRQAGAAAGWGSDPRARRRTPVGRPDGDAQGAAPAWAVRRPNSGGTGCRNPGERGRQHLQVSARPSRRINKSTSRKAPPATVLTENVHPGALSGAHSSPFGSFLRSIGIAALRRFVTLHDFVTLRGVVTKRRHPVT